MAARFFLSQRGNDKLGYQGYIYQCQRKIDGVITWRCEAREKPYKCGGRAKSVGDKVTITREHTHPPDYDRVEQQILKRSIIENAAATGVLRSKDLSGIVSTLPENIASHLPTIDSMKRAIRRRQIASTSKPMDKPDEYSIPGPPSFNEYYTSITETAGLFDDESPELIFDEDKGLNQLIFDQQPTTSFSLSLNKPESPISNFGIPSNNGVMEFLCNLQTQVNDLKVENESLKQQLKKTTDRLLRVEKRLKMNEIEFPVDARFESARLTLSKMGTFQFYGGPKTVDVASFIRQVAPEAGTSDPKFVQSLFIDCIKTILGDSIIYYSYDKPIDEKHCQLDHQLFDCILGLICDGYGLNKDPLKDTDKDKYLRECIEEELRRTATKVFNQSKPKIKTDNFQARPNSDTTTIKTEASLDDVTMVSSDSDDGY